MLAAFSKVQSGSGHFIAGFHNTTEALSVFPEMAEPWKVALDELTVSDIKQDIAPRVLLMTSLAYDSVYANKVRNIVEKNFPQASISEYRSAMTAESLRAALVDKDLVLMVYPSNTEQEPLTGLSKVWTDFVRRGGSVIITGTHRYDLLQQLSLLNPESGYYSNTLPVNMVYKDHPIAEGLPDDAMMLDDMVYPLDISDSGFTIVAEVNGYPVMGYKMLDKGKVIYLGLEYYHNEKWSVQAMKNSILWACKDKAPRVSVQDKQVTQHGATSRMITRREEYLTSGTGDLAKVDVKIYPNPYYSKATLDLDLPVASTVSIDITNEAGQLSASLLSKKNLSVATYHFDLPNLPTGVYFLRCQVGNQQIVRKVVKAGNE